MKRTEGPRAKGFTLIEVLVALVVLTVGLLGLSATAAMVASEMRASHLRTRVKARAQAELEWLLASGAEGPGEIREDGVRIVWEVGGASLREISLVVELSTGRGSFADTLVALVRAP
jgi:prepilin-type N-terminal cleavage/methylation domain-containing protein